MFFSGFGQSFLLGQYFFHIKKDLLLTGTDLSIAYSLGTLAASFNLSTIGSIIDKWSWKKSTLVTVSFIFLGQLILSQANSLLFLFLGFYVLLCFGQMTLSSITATLIGKVFGGHRGKFNTMAYYGRSLAEGILPSFVAFLISVVMWRNSFILSGFFILIIMVPTTLLLADRIGKSPIYADKNRLKNTSPTKNMSWKDLLSKEKKAFFMMLGFTALPFILTGIFIQQGDLVESRGFEMKDAALGFVFFSCFQIIGNTIFGFLVDRFGAFNLVLFLPLFLSVAIFLLMTGSSLQLFFIAFGFLGFSVGVQNSVVNAFWAEAYGTRCLGRIKGMDSTMVVLSTSLAPLVFSFLLDQGFSFSFVMGMCLGLLGVSLITLFLGIRMFKFSS